MKRDVSTFVNVVVANLLKSNTSTVGMAYRVIFLTIIRNVISHILIRMVGYTTIRVSCIREYAGELHRREEIIKYKTTASARKRHAEIIGEFLASFNLVPF